MQLTTSCYASVFLLVFAAMVPAAVLPPSQDTPDVPYPTDFRSWHHVKSIIVGPGHDSFAVRGGIHHYYANDRAMDGYRDGTFPNGAVIVDEGVFTTEGEGHAKGVTLEGDRRSVDVMVKNAERYKDTGGWGYEHFDRDSTTPTLTASTRSICFQCHSKATRDHVFSTVRK